MEFILNETQISRNLQILKESTYNLPDFLFQHLKIHKTSLGDNPCFPNEQEYPYDYKIIKDRYKDILSKMEKYEEFNGISLEEAKNICNKLIDECKNKEKPIRDLLNEICNKTVNQLLMVPDNIVLFTCHLVDNVEPKRSPRIMPEENEDGTTYQFDDVNDIEQSQKSVLKRRFINSLIQGAANTYSKRFDSYADEIFKVDESLPKLYEKILLLNDFILFNEEEKITEKSYSPSAYVSVTLGEQGCKTTIESQGVIFPFLLQESIRGFFELFASHSLPKDDEKAMYLIRHADFVLAENWDLRFGVTLWQEITRLIDNDGIIPFYFTKLCELPTDVFNKEMKEILSNTKHGIKFMQELITKSENEITFSDIPDNYENDEIQAIITDDVNDEFLTLEEIEKIKI